MNLRARAEVMNFGLAELTLPAQDSHSPRRPFHDVHKNRGNLSRSDHWALSGIHGDAKRDWPGPEQKR
jgi:hypothetical protein